MPTLRAGILSEKGCREFPVVAKRRCLRVCAFTGHALLSRIALGV